MHLYLIRHTRVAEPAGVCYGRRDVPLAATFAEEARSVVARLPRVEAPLVVSSPATRCLALARCLSPAPRLEPDLAELNFGAWEGRPWDELPRAEVDDWAADFVAGRPPGGESFAELAGRGERVLAALCAQGAPAVICVTHAGMIRALLCQVLGLPLARAFSFDVAHGGITGIEWRPTGPVVGFVNR